MQIIWKATALEDRLRIFEYLAERNPQAALEIDALFSQKTTQLLDHPKLHKAGRIKGTREAVVHPHYILVYTVTDERIVIVRVLHTAQNWS